MHFHMNPYISCCSRHLAVNFDKLVQSYVLPFSALFSGPTDAQKCSHYDSDDKL